MKIRVLEIISILLLSIGVIFDHLFQDPQGFLLLMLLIISVLYAIGGYYIFRPNKNVKLSTSLSITTGILLSIEIFIANGIISTGNINNSIFSVGVFIPILVINCILFYILYSKNKKNIEGTQIVKSIIYRALIVYTLCLVVGILPDNWRIVFFHGTESSTYYKLKQNNCIEESKKYVDKDDYNNGINSAIQALTYSSLRKESTDYLHQNSLNVLGYAYYMNGDYRKADSVYKIVIEINKNNNLSDDESDYERTIYNYGLLYSSWGYYYKSDSIFYTCLKKYEYSDLSLAYINDCLADNQKGRGYFLNADSLYKVAISYHEKTNLENKTSYINVLRSLGKNYSSRSYYLQADSLYISVLDMTKKEYGEENLLYANILDDIMTLYKTIAKYEKAKEYGESSLKIKQKILGSESSEFISTQIKVAGIHMILSEYNLAEKTLLQSLSSIEKKYSLQSPLACRAYDNLFDLYTDLYQLGNAEIYADKSLHAREEYYGTYNINTASSIDNKAYLYYCNSKLFEADSMYGKSLGIKKHYSGTNNPNFAHSLNGLGLVIMEKGNLLKADTLFNYTLEILEHSVGRLHPSYATTLNNKAYLKIKEKDYTNAEKYFQESIKINSLTFGEKNIHIAENYTGLAELRAEQNNYSEAKAYYLKALSIYQNIFKGSHSKILSLKTKIETLEKIKSPTN